MSLFTVKNSPLVPLTSLVTTTLFPKKERSRRTSLDTYGLCLDHWQLKDLNLGSLGLWFLCLTSPLLPFFFPLYKFSRNLKWNIQRHFFYSFILTLNQYKVTEFYSDFYQQILMNHHKRKEKSKLTYPCLKLVSNPNYFLYLFGEGQNRDCTLLQSSVVRVGIVFIFTLFTFSLLERTWVVSWLQRFVWGWDFRLFCPLRSLSVDSRRMDVVFGVLGLWSFL